MEAPVPASALIHSATLVSAGIYLVSRFSFCFLSSPVLLQLFQLLTAATAFYGAAVAAFQTDVKKILAYSTISHCGMLMYSITLFRPEITLFYLFAHGFFKSLNFLCVGNFVQYANNYQDVSRMGGLSSSYRFESFFLFVTVFNLSSAPLFLAFFSKHWLINAAAHTSPYSSVTSALLFAAAYCGFFYSAKLYNETVLSKKRAHSSAYGTRAVHPATFRLVRRANNLGLVGMLLLFVYAAVILAMLFAQIAAGGS
jgi:NADH-quinone oxidoreductase subunit L